MATDPGKPFKKVCIPSATAVDNTGVAPTITNDVGAESKEFVVSSTPHVVKYTARDAAGLSSSCTLQITVSGKKLTRSVGTSPCLHTLGQRVVGWSGEGWDKFTHGLILKAVDALNTDIQPPLQLKALYEYLIIYAKIPSISIVTITITHEQYHVPKHHIYFLT